MSAGFFESFYQSPIQHPILLWIANLLGTTLALIRMGRLDPSAKVSIRKFILFWAIVSMLDAWLSANHVFGIGTLPAPFGSLVPFLFVWAGDFRIFLAMESRKPTLRSVVASFIVPALAGILTLGREPRVLFITYETLFVVWILLFSRWTGLTRAEPAKRIRNLSLLFYGFWVLADGMILFLPASLRDFGFAVRVIPNGLYYGAFGYVCARAWGSKK